jgi:triacylglycerol esterase/lipase EstA (alpha/beta hydrolase family)
MVKKFSAADLPLALLKEASWLGYVMPILTESVVCQWQKNIGLYKYETLDQAVDKARLEHSAEKVNLVGHSMGGLEALAYTVNHPGEVDNCVSVASPFSGTNASVGGLSALFFGVYLKTVFQLTPDSDYIKTLKQKLQNAMPEFEANDVKLTNIWSPIDEFMTKGDCSIETILGRKSENLEEFEFNLGHCSVFYCKETTEMLHTMIDESPYPTILVHGLMMNKRFFKKFAEEIPKALEHKVYALSYDFAKALEI